MTTMNENTLWQTKLAARLHDPAEKALVLLRDPAGHENGTSAALKRLLGLDQLPETIDPDNADALANVVFKKGLPIAIYRHVQRADWWAAAADRPQWPMQEITVTTKEGQQKTFAVAPWAQVRWTTSPVLTHPLTGKTFDLHNLTDVSVKSVKDKAFAHFKALLETLGIQGSDAADWRKILLAFWRFGPEIEEENDNSKLGALWELLPADTRVPDHSIWDHLDLASAFAGAFAADPEGEVALLALSIGPVQSFIAAARKVEDLWAGSHLLSRLSWETMRPVAEKLGPDAILFPRLRGIPQVDLWLRDAMGLPEELFANCEWRRSATDANPLFAAALPNRFVAVVPKSQVRDIAAACEKSVRDWLLQTGLTVVDRLLETAGFKSTDAARDEHATPAYAQMREQLEGFPEVHWAAVPFSLIRCRDEAKQRDLDTTQLSQAMAPFFGVEADEPCGFLKSPAWEVLQKEIDWGDGTTFFAPNPGVLYPAVYDLAERVLAAAKSVRAFEQTRQEGWRDTLTGEAEWLTTDRTQLFVPAGKRRSRKDEGFREGEHVETLWTKVADEKPAWAKKGEHLSALPAIKRLWPTLFAEEVGEALGKKGSADRFVVSTHTMALAKNLQRLAEGKSEAIATFLKDEDKAPALPRSLAQLRGSLAARIPAALDRLRESDAKEDEQRLAQLESKLKDVLGHKPETYYALLLMDGDKMGAILSGDEKAGCAITYRESFHPDLRAAFDEKAQQHEQIRKYGAQIRPPSPNRHLAISGALNDFSQHVVPHVVEVEHLGKLIYAGGDDVLAMLPVADVLACMARLREAYSGTSAQDESIGWKEAVKNPNELYCKQQFALLEGRLMRMMGDKATASCGAVVAHHQVPLSAVLRELRAAEKRAKDAGRDRFSLTVIKRSGGALYLTAKWGEPMKLLMDLRNFLAGEDTSRRAVYHSLQWLEDLPDPPEHEMLQALLAYQLRRQSGNDKRAPDLAQRLAKLALVEKEPLDWLRNFLTVAEFLARETRSPVEDTARETATEGADA